MSASTRRALELDPIASERRILTIGAGPRIVELLEPFGRVVPVPVGAHLASAAWAHVDVVVVAVDRPDCPASIGLSSPERALAMVAIIEALRAAGEYGVERIVLDGAGPTQPHSGALCGVADLCLGPERGQPTPGAHSWSPAATALLRGHSIGFSDDAIEEA